MACWHTANQVCGEAWPWLGNLRLSPDFAGNSVEGVTEIKARTSVAALLMPLLILLWHAPLYRTYKAVT